MNWVFETYSNVYNTAMMHEAMLQLRNLVAKFAVPSPACSPAPDRAVRQIGLRIILGALFFVQK
jgi:hypothetical protein